MLFGNDVKTSFLSCEEDFLNEVHQEKDDALNSIRSWLEYAESDLKNLQGDIQKIKQYLSQIL